MKQILTLLTLLSVTFSGLAQNTDSKSYDDLMRQSKKARTMSIIMVSTGPVIAAGGIGTLIYGLVENALADPGYYYDSNGNYVALPAKKYTTEIVVGAAAAAVGIGIALSSIHFSNKASNLKHEARKMKLKTSTDHINIPGFQNNPVYAGNRQFKFSLIIPLGR